MRFLDYLSGFFGESSANNAESPASFLRRGLMVIVFGFGGFLLWAAVAPLDRAITGSGLVSVSDQRKTVQHVLGGEIHDIAAREGQRVEAGQVLLTLNTDQTSAELLAVHRQLVLLRASLERLAAEREHKPVLQFSEGLNAFAGPEGAEILNAQLEFFHSRARSIRAELDQLAARESQAAAEASGLRQMIVSRQARVAILGRQLEAITGLAESGHYPKLQLMTVERQKVEAEADVTESRANLMRAEQAQLEARSATARRSAEILRDLDAENLEDERQRAVLESKMTSLEYALNHSKIVAPVAGTIVGLSVHTVGGVIQAGQHLMDIVPEDDPYVVEAQFPLESADRLEKGQEVDLHFSSLDRARTPIVSGHVLTVSADRLQDDRRGISYILVRVDISRKGLSELAASGLQVRPGLPVEVFAKGGQRSFLRYLIKPVTDRFSKALIE